MISRSVNHDAPVSLECAGSTDAGSRATNDDHFLIGDLDDGLRVARTSVPELARTAEPGAHLRRPVLMVADGVSGQPGAELASALATRAVAGGLEELTIPAREGAAVDAVAEAMRVTGGRLRELAQSPAWVPATSATVAVVDWPHVELVHVGHTRCYLHRGGRLRQLTTDHTIAEMLRRAGSDCGPGMDHVLTRAIGAEDQAPDHRRLDLVSGDTLLVASNGLTDALDDRRISSLLGSRPWGSAEECCDQVLRSVLGPQVVHRNVTIVVLTAR